VVALLLVLLVLLLVLLVLLLVALLLLLLVLLLLVLLMLVLLLLTHFPNRGKGSEPAAAVRALCCQGTNYIRIPPPPAAGVVDS